MVVVSIDDRSVNTFEEDTIDSLEQILSEVEIGLDHVKSMKQP